MNQETELIERFDPKTEARIISKLDKIFTCESTLSEDQAIKTPFLAVMDPANVLMCIAKTDKAKRVLCRFGNIEAKEPTLNYDVKQNSKNISKFNLEYLFNIIAILKAVDYESIKISLKQDYPITLEDDDFKFILAPRVEND